MRKEPSGSSIGEKKRMITDLYMLACPVTAVAAMKISMVLSAVSMAAQYMGQKSAAKKQSAYQDHLAGLQRQAGYRKEASIIRQNIQAEEATARKANMVRQEGEKASAEARGSAIAGGVSGLSVEYYLSEYEAQEGAYIYALEEERRLQFAETERVLGDVHLSTTQQMAQANAPVSTPSLAGTALAMGASMYGKLADIKDYEERSEDRKLFGVPFRGGHELRRLPSDHRYS